MGMLDLFRRDPAAKAAGGRASEELFDDEFQRKLETLAVVSRRVFAGRMRAERRSKKRGSGVEFADHRDYAPGDDFRFVDWNVYQRFGRLLIRLYEEEEDLSIYFVIDCSRSMSFAGSPKFDHARRLCAALAYVGLANLDRVTIVGVGDGIISRLPTTRGKNRIHSVLNFLRGLEAEHTTDLRSALKTFVAQHKRRGLAVLISDFYDPAGFEGGINMLRYNKFEPYALHIVDPRDASPNVKGDVRVYDCETGEEREVTVTETLLQRMAEEHERYSSQIEQFCTKTQVPYFRASTQQPVEDLVLQVFRRGGFLR